MKCKQLLRFPPSSNGVPASGGGYENGARSRSVATFFLEIVSVVEDFPALHLANRGVSARRAQMTRRLVWDFPARCERAMQGRSEAIVGRFIPCAGRVTPRRNFGGKGEILPCVLLAKNQPARAREDRAAASRCAFDFGPRDRRTGSEKGNIFRTGETRGVERRVSRLVQGVPCECQAAMQISGREGWHGWRYALEPTTSPIHDITRRQSLLRESQAKHTHRFGERPHRSARTDPDGNRARA